MIRAPSPCTKHSQGANRCDGGQEDVPDEEKVILPSATTVAATVAVRGLLADTSGKAPLLGAALMPEVTEEATCDSFFSIVSAWDSTAYSRHDSNNRNIVPKIMMQNWTNGHRA